MSTPQRRPIMAGVRVSTPEGRGIVRFVRMAPPDYSTPEAASVLLDSRAGDGVYYGTMFSADKLSVVDDPDQDPAYQRYLREFPRHDPRD